MKKMICMLMALAVVTVSCSKKKTKSSPDPVDTAAVEQPLIVYGADEFQTIDVPFTVADEEADITAESIDFTDLDFGLHYSPCKNWETYGTENDPVSPFYNQDDEIREKLKSTADEPEIEQYSISGDTIYLYVGFDRIHFNLHDWSVFSYDIPTGELTELYNYSSDTEAMGGFGVACMIGSKLFDYDYENENSTLFCFDAATAEKTEIYQSIGYINIQSYNDESLIFSTIDWDEEGTGSVYELYEYTLATGETRLLKSGETSNHAFHVSACCSELTAVMYKAEDSREYEVLTDHYKLSTGITSGEVVYADDDTVIISSSNNECLIHCYDIPGRKHYVTSTAGSSSGVHCADGKIYLGSFDNLEAIRYQYVPELGMALKLPGSLSAGGVRCDGDILSFPSYSYQSTDHISNYRITRVNICR